MDHRDTYVSRRSDLKNLVTSETADVPPFVLVKINFVVRGAWSRGASTPGTPPGAATDDLNMYFEAIFWLFLLLPLHSAIYILASLVVVWTCCG